MVVSIVARNDELPTLIVHTPIPTPSMLSMPTIFFSSFGKSTNTASIVVIKDDTLQQPKYKYTIRIV
jgi:hypothetical protein